MPETNKRCPVCGYQLDTKYFKEYKDIALCLDCYENFKKYHENPYCEEYHSELFCGTIEFFGNEEDGPFLGLELEIDRGSNDVDLLALTNKMFPYNFIVFEHDGSLECGIECITRPATFAFHSSIEDVYTKFFHIATRKPYLYKSHNTSTCGLHVHFNRSYFDDDYVSEKSDLCIMRLLYIFEKFWNELLIFSRRKDSQLHYCNRYYQDLKEVVENQNIKGEDRCLDRYMAVNLTNPKTIELRLFRGTMNIETFFASLELANNIIVLSKHSSIKDLKAMKFDELLTNERLFSYWKRAQERAERLRR